jgi:catechol 2,3-dioxygenase-like lactoylglutathione lyase family enzyme
MKRLHIHLAVADLEGSVRFYSNLLGAAPVLLKDDYARWVNDDPPVHLAISTRGTHPGVDHFGIQVDDANALKEVRARMARAGGALLDQDNTSCCYARSDKTWTIDPQGTRWEAFLTVGDAEEFAEAGVDMGTERTCCAPDIEDRSCCT